MKSFYLLAGCSFLVALMMAFILYKFLIIAGVKDVDAGFFAAISIPLTVSVFDEIVFRLSKKQNLRGG